MHHKPMKPGSDPRECLKTKGKVLASKTSSPISATSHSLVRLLSTNEPARHKDGDKTARFGFYFPVHDQVEGVIEVLKSARHFYPEAPIYVLQDGGSVDFSPLCKLPRQEGQKCNRLLVCIGNLCVSCTCIWVSA